MPVYEAYIELSVRIVKVAKKVAETALVFAITFAYSGYLAWIAAQIKPGILTRGEAIFVQAVLIGVGAGTWLVCLYLLRKIWSEGKSKPPLPPPSV
jgi:hypothetical protein